MRNNNKGFIATSVLFGIVALLFITIAIILGNSQSSIKNTKIYGSMLKAEINNYLSVKLHPNGGTLEKTTLEINFNGTYGILPIPEKTGYIFNGWYTKESDGVVGEDSVSDNDPYQKHNAINLYAYWAPELFELTIDANGGTFNNDFPGKINLAYNQKYLLPIPEKIGYALDGWEIVSGDTLEVKENELKMGYGNAEIKAKWKKADAKLTVDLSGGTMEYETDKIISGVAVFDLEYGETKEIPNPTKEGYMFSGWTLEGVELNGTNAIVKSENARMTAKWEILTNIKYGVRHYQEVIDYVENKENEEEEEVGKYVLVEADTTYGEATYMEEVEVTAKTYRGFSVNGDITTDENGKTIVDNKQTIYIEADETNNFADFYYSRLSYLITVDPNGGTYNGEIEKLYQYGKTIDIKTEFPDPTRIGYNFINWEVSSGVIDANTYTMDAENVTLKAKWIANNVIVNLNSNGGILTNPSIEVAYDSPYGKLEEPIRTGYKFKGWSLTSDGNNIINSETIVKTAEKHTLYAVWEANKYNVTLHLRGGSYDNETVETKIIEVTYGSPYNIKIPTRDKHEFYGWYKELEHLNEVETTDIVLTPNDHDLYAIWKPTDAEFINYTNTTYTECTTVACALDELYEKFK